MGAAVAAHERVERPSLPELIAVLVVCGGLLFALASMDERARKREAGRAMAVLAERAEQAAGRAEREAVTAPAGPPRERADGPERKASPIVIPAGSAWGPGTSVVSHTPRSAPRAVATPALRRIDGTPPAAAPASPRAARPPARDWGLAGPVALALMGFAGLALIAGGLRLLRSSAQPPVGVTR